MRRILKWFRRLILILVVLALLVGFGVIALDRHYHFLWASPTLPVEKMCPRPAAIEAVLHIGRAAAIWQAQLEQKTGLPPEWLGRVLPREAAFFCQTDPIDATADLTLFVNERRFGPALASLLNRIPDWHATAFVRWANAGFAWEKPGLIRRRGALPIPEDLAQILQHYRRVDTELPAESAREAAFFEMRLDNRDGGAVASFMSLHRALAGRPAAYTPEALAKNLEIVGWSTVAATAATPETIDLEWVIACLPDAPEAGISELAYLTDVLREEAANALRNQFNLNLWGGTTREGTSLRCDWHLSGYLALWGM